MRFTIAGLLLFFVMLWSGMAAAGVRGIFVAVYLLAVALTLRVAVWGERKTAERARWGVLLLAILGLPLFLPEIGAPREASRRARCTNNLYRIGNALAAYHQQQGCFPPAYVCDEDGKPWHSWRVLILPFMEETALYKRYRFDEPWDGPHNRKLADEMPGEYRCPCDPDGTSSSTSYVAVVGPETSWPGAKSSNADSNRDGVWKTILLVESAESGIHWMEPKDLAFEEVLGASDDPYARRIASGHGSGTYAMFGDGHVGFMRHANTITDQQIPDATRALLTIAGGETTWPDEDVGLRSRTVGPARRISQWANFVAWLLLAICCGVFVLWPPRGREEAGNRSQVSEGIG